MNPLFAHRLQQPNVVLMLAHRLRRWANNKTTSVRLFVRELSSKFAKFAYIFIQIVQI